MTTRAGKCNEKDYAKLQRLVNYVAMTEDEVSITGIEEIRILHAYINASYVACSNVRSYASGAVLFRIGLVALVL